MSGNFLGSHSTAGRKMIQAGPIRHNDNSMVDHYYSYLLPSPGVVRFERSMRLTNSLPFLTREVGGTAPKEGIIYIYIALYLHGTDGIVCVQSTYATLYVGDPVSIFCFTSGRGWHEERKEPRDTPLPQQ